MLFAPRQWMPADLLVELYDLNYYSVTVHTNNWGRRADCILCHIWNGPSLSTHNTYFWTHLSLLRHMRKVIEWFNSCHSFWNFSSLPLSPSFHFVVFLEVYPNIFQHSEVVICGCNWQGRLQIRCCSVSAASMSPGLLDLNESLQREERAHSHHVHAFSYAHWQIPPRCCSNILEVLLSHPPILFVGLQQQSASFLSFHPML